MDHQVVTRGIRADVAAIERWDEFTGDRREEAMRGDLWVARVGESSEPVGYLALSGSFFFSRVFITRICVRDDCRRQGLARALLETALARYAGLDVWTSTEEGNVGAKVLFRNAGFKAVGTLGGLNRDGSGEQFFVRSASV